MSASALSAFAAKVRFEYLPEAGLGCGRCACSLNWVGVQRLCFENKREK
jgi:hypothetical protein